MTGLNGRAGRAYLENEPRFVCAIDPRGIRLVAGLRQGFDAPDNPSRTQRPTDPTRVHTGIVGRTSTNERWQAEDCGRQMTDKHPKRPRDLKGTLWRLRHNTAHMACATSPLDVSLPPDPRRPGSTSWKACSPGSQGAASSAAFSAPSSISRPLSIPSLLRPTPPQSPSSGPQIQNACWPLSSEGRKR